jgi:short-subunit dehydrogenase
MLGGFESVLFLDLSGASEGIGRALVLNLTKRSAKLVIAARSLAKLKTRVSEALGATALAVPIGTQNLSYS